MRKLFLLAAAVLAFPGRGHASEPLFDSTPLDDSELEQARGGFILPGGIEIAFGATITTTVGNDVALRTTMVLNEDGSLGYSSTGGAIDGQNVSVHVGNSVGNSATGSIGANGANVLLDVETANVFIRHVVGSGIASIVANTVDHAQIDSQVAIDVKLDNVAPLAVGSGAFLIEAMGADAASFRAP